MAVGDVDRVHGVETARQLRLCFGVAHHPKRVADAIVSRGVGVRRAGRQPREQFVNDQCGGIANQDRPGVRAQRLDLAHAVVLLRCLGEFVLANAVGIVISYRCCRHQPRLPVLAHDDAVDVVARRRIANEHARLQHAVEIVRGFRVDLRRVRIGIRRQIDFRLGDVEEAPRFARSARSRFSAREHVRKAERSLRQRVWERGAARQTGG